MNKLKVTLTGLFVACLSIGMVSAQANTTAAKPATAKKSTTKAKSSKEVAPTTGSRKDIGTSQPKPAQHLKKDGTPDKRYKENKTTKPAGTAATPAPKNEGTKK